MSDSIESRGKSVEEAVSEALLQLGARRDEVEVEVLEEGKSGLWGLLGGRTARVRVTRKAAGGRGRAADRGGPHAAGGRAAGEERPRGEPAPEGRGRPEGRREQPRGEGPPDRGGRGRRGGRGGRGGREDRGGERRDQPRSRAGGPSEADGGQGKQPEAQADARGGGRGDARSEPRGRGRQGGREGRDQGRRSAAGGAASGAEGRGDAGRRAEGRREEARREEGRHGEGRRRASGGRREFVREGQDQDMRLPGERVEQGAGLESALPGEAPPMPAEPWGSHEQADFEALTAARATTGGEAPPNPVNDVLPGQEVEAALLVPPLRNVPAEEAPAALVTLTSELMARAGFPCRCEVKEGDYHLVKVTTDESSAAVLIGRHGGTVDALEHLVERMAAQAVGGQVHMNLDVNNYRRRREERLVQRAQQAAERVQQTGQELHFEPLTARERRIVHLEVAKHPGVQTFTIADGAGKHVVVARADAPVPAEAGREPRAGGDPEAPGFEGEPGLAAAPEGEGALPDEAEADGNKRLPGAYDEGRADV